MRHPLPCIVLLIVVATAFGAEMASSRKASDRNSSRYETAIVAGGCFWGLQERLRHIPGVIQTTVGYTGGWAPNPTYELVAAGKTGHTEAVQVIFDPRRLNYATLLTDFLTGRDPVRAPASLTSSARWGIFYCNEQQHQIALEVKTSIDQSHRWNLPIPTEIEPLKTFYVAEDYHQDYYRKHAAAGCSLF